MTLPINIKSGRILITISPDKKFDSSDTFQEITDPEELSSCWDTLKHIVDKFIDEQIDRSRSVAEQNAKIRDIVDIHNSLVTRKTVDEEVLLKEVLNTGRFSKEEAKSLIKKVKQEKIDGGMAWY